MIEDYYTQSVIIQKVTRSTAWGSTDAWGTSQTILASMNPISGAEVFVGEKNNVYADYSMKCGSTVTIDETRRVKWDGKILEVVFVKNTLGMDHHLSVYLKKRDT